MGAAQTPILAEKAHEVTQLRDFMRVFLRMQQI